MSRPPTIAFTDLPLFADEALLGAALLGPDRVAEWPKIAAELEGKGLPAIDPTFRGRYTPAVRAFFDYAYGLTAFMPSPEARWDDVEVADFANFPEAGPCVYFAAAGSFIKIGYSSNWPNRIAHLQVACPYRISAVLVISGTQSTEAELHERFKDLRIHGEWFRRSAELLEFIEQRKLLPKPAGSE